VLVAFVAADIRLLNFDLAFKQFDSATHRETQPMTHEPVCSVVGAGVFAEYRAMNLNLQQERNSVAPTRHVFLPRDQEDAASRNEGKAFPAARSPDLVTADASIETIATWPDARPAKTLFSSRNVQAVIGVPKE
jgi:hypothetical protein